MLRRTPENDDARFVTCPACGGEGGCEVAVYSYDDPYLARWEDCVECGGAGLVEDCGNLSTHGT